MESFSYVPPFADEHIVAIAQRRGIIAAGETFSDAFERVAERLASVDTALGGRGMPSFRKKLQGALGSGRLGLSSQLLASAGRNDRVAACTVLAVPHGSDGPRLRALVADAAAASEAGMGCGIDLTEFTDPAGVAVKVNDALLRVHRGLVAQGRRPPAFMLTCSAGHPRAIEFANAKASADFGAWVANISMMFGDDGAVYEGLRETIAAAAHRNGEPGVLFSAPVEEDNPTPEYRVVSTAPCAEVFMAPGERCVFVSVNLAAHVTGGVFDWGLFAESAALAVRVADNAVELAIDGASSVVAARRRVGVGICGLHTSLMAQRIPYAAGRAFAGAVAERLVYAAHAEACRLAAVRGAFPAWAESRWRDLTWLRRKSAARSGAISAQAWAKLEENILRHGVRNAVVVAYPPTGIVSELLGVSKSYEPHFDLRGRNGSLRPEVAAVGGRLSSVSDDGQVAGVDGSHLLACARQISPGVHLDMHAQISRLADEAGSKTINLPAAATVDEVAVLMDRVRQMRLKGLTVFRDGCLSESRREVAA